MKDSTLISSFAAHFKLRSLEDGVEYLLDQKGLLVGREVECSLPIDSGQVSRYHAKITIENGQVIVEDLRSTNGTYVNGRRLAQPQAIVLGDEIRFHDRAFRLVSSREESGNAAETQLQMEVYAPSTFTPPKSVPAAVSSTEPDLLKSESLKSKSFVPTEPTEEKKPSAIWHKVQALQKSKMQDTFDTEKTPPAQVHIPVAGKPVTPEPVSPESESLPHNASGIWEKVQALANSSQKKSLKKR